LFLSEHRNKIPFCFFYIDYLLSCGIIQSEKRWKISGWLKAQSSKLKAENEKSELGFTGFMINFFQREIAFLIFI